MINKEELNLIIKKYEDKIIKARRHLHQHPELSFKEFETMQYICSYLNDIGVEYKSGIAGTGILAIIKGNYPSDNKKTLLIRADIDALPIEERSDKPYISKNNGVMHACGHDGHTAILLGVCEILNELKNEFSGCVKLIFQPGEETDGGAKPMIEEGVLENPAVDACLALHLEPGLKSGVIQIKPNLMYASPDNFKIIVKGRGGHGSEPHKCIDPISISAQIVTELSRMVAREIDPFDSAVVSVCSIHGGSASNVIPSNVEISGTARSLTNEMRAFLKRRIGEIANSLCESRGAICEYEFIESYPPLINDEELAKQLFDVAAQYIDEKNCIYGGASTMAGEDFAYFTQKLPSVMFKLGCGNEDKGIINPLHHESFDIDESCLKFGATLFSAFALEFLS